MNVGIERVEGGIVLVLKKIIVDVYFEIDLLVELFFLGDFFLVFTLYFYLVVSLESFFLD